MPEAKLHFEDFKVGPFGEFGPRLVTREELISFAAEFDPQGMHLDEDAGRDSLLHGLSASGWHSCCILMKLIVDGFMLRSTSMGSGGIEEVRWLKPVRAGDQLTVRGTVTATRPSRSRPEMGLVSFLFEMFNAQGICVMTLKTPIMMGRREPGAPAA